MPWGEAGTETPGAGKTPLNARVWLGCVAANGEGKEGRRGGGTCESSEEEERQMLPFFTPAEMEGKGAGGKGPKPLAFRDSPRGPLGSSPGG